ncbi:7-cyano-7-deazaguanine synthase QueC [candidate division KSB1 bacterium]|nr:7-cyano-7-deazaguanine synthase QueC [candidate division KSB1 bacterium]
MSHELAVVLASGGMDSAVTTAIANQTYRLALLHLNYGQRTAARELQAFEELADFYQVEKTLVADVGHLAQIGGSSLTDTKIEVEEANLKSKEIPTSYVPFRNANLLAIATSWAEVISATKIFIGAVEEDSSGYPDCRREFYDAFEKVINVGTKPSTQIEIVTPIITLKKYEIVLKGKKLGVPFELTWSCYQSEDAACGVCDSCGFRLRGFQKAGLEDPIEYAERPVYQ